MSLSKEQKEAERVRFEAWALTKYPLAVQNHSLGAYARGMKRCAEEGWMARALLSDEARELFRIWQSHLGASRDHCDEPGRKLWDRIDALTGTGRKEQSNG